MTRRSLQIGSQAGLPGRLRFEALELADYRGRLGAVAVTPADVRPAHHAVGVDDEGGGCREAVTEQVVHPVLPHHVGFAVVEDGEGDPDATDDRFRPGEVVGAYGHDLGAQFLDLFVLVGQLDQLTPAVGSPEGAVEDDHHRALFQSGRKRMRLTRGAGQLEVGSRFAYRRGGRRRQSRCYRRQRNRQ